MAVNSLVSSVAQNLSTDVHTKYVGKSVIEIVKAMGAAVVSHRSGLNLDMRWSARGAWDPESIQYEVCSLIEKSTEFSAYIQSYCSAEFLNTRDYDRSNMLIFTALSITQEFPFLALDDSINLNLINNENLYIYENFIRDEYEITSRKPYSVFETSDLGEDMHEDDKFSYISITASHLVGDESLLKKLIGSLKPNGSLVIRNTGDGRTLYTADFMAHPFYDMHRILLESDGDTLHDSGLMGRTVFRKSA
jgi:hypothetical protein